MRFHSSTFTGCIARMFKKSCNIVSRRIVAASAASDMGRIVVRDITATTGGIVVGRIDGGLIALRRAIAGERVRMMPLCG